jgi:glucose/mannose transport system substrate-binding protein
MNGVGRSLIPVLLLAAVGCSDSYVPPDTDTVELYTWWTKGGEQQALDAMLEQHHQSHPKTTVVSIGQQGDGTVARDRIEVRISEGYPPELFQSNFGSGAMRNWLEFNGPDTQAIQPLNDLFAEQGWTDVYPQLLIDSVSIDGDIYAVPLNIHRTNSLFFNKHVFDEIGMDPPRTLEEFYAVGDALLAHDPPIVPLAISSQGAWTINLTMMENLLITMAGPEFYNSYFTGQETADAPEMVATLEEMLVIWNGYVNDDSAELGWDGAVQMVADGEAAMTIMGDWAKGYLQTAAMGATPDVAAEEGLDLLQPGVDFGQMPTFGTSSAFVFTGDCFPMTTDAKNPTGGLELLKTFGSKEAQDAFNPIKGSIPARTDTDIDVYDDLARQTYADFNDENVVVLKSLSALVPTDFGKAVEAAIPEMLDTGEPTAVIDALKEVYPLLQ